MVYRIALVAHDGKKDDLVAWVQDHASLLKPHDLYGTGTTGGRVIEATGLSITRLKSGPLGGDAQLGAMIAEGKIDVLIFFTDPMSALPHDVDVKSLLRLATLYDTLLAVNPATASAVMRTLGTRGTEA